METIKIIYNPDSGRQIAHRNLPVLVDVLVKNNYYVKVFPTQKQYDATRAASQACKDGDDIIISFGGDGTVNEVVNGMMENDFRPKLAIYPAGTVNDFANYLQIPRNIEEFAQLILQKNTILSDVGRGGERYFLNVAAAGLLTDVAYKVSSESKSILGRFAYYFEGIREIQRQMFDPIKIKITYGDIVETKEVLFFILANSASVGGFKFIAPEASINDGKLDLMIVEKGELMDTASIFVKALVGNHTQHPNLKYVQVDSIRIECEEEILMDLDGEQYGKLPMDFKVEKQAIPIIVP